MTNCTQKLVAAKNNYTTKSIEAEKTLKEAELSAKNASSQYSVDVSGADSDITDAKDTLSDAEEALEAFEAAIGDDGTIYAEYTETLPICRMRQEIPSLPAQRLPLFPIRMR